LDAPTFRRRTGAGIVFCNSERTLELAAYAHGFDLDAPFEKLLAKRRTCILYGYPPVGAPRDSGDDSKKSKIKSTKSFRFRASCNFSSAILQTPIPILSRMDDANICPRRSADLLRKKRLRSRIAGRETGGQGPLPIHGAFAGLRPGRPLTGLLRQLTPRRKRLLRARWKKSAERIDFLLAVGLGYLSLKPFCGTLSGGEAQRIRWLPRFGFAVACVLYVRTSPRSACTTRDNDRLLGSLERLRNLGNTVIVVEHDEDTIRPPILSWILAQVQGMPADIVVAQGKPEQIAASAESLTGQYLSGFAKFPSLKYDAVLMENPSRFLGASAK